MEAASMVNTLNPRRVTDAFSLWRGGKHFNCWGATLYVLNVLGRPVWAERDVMEAWLEQNAKPVYRPRAGDVVVITRWGCLDHTAVYLGKGKYFQKLGMNRAEVTTLAGVRKHYHGETTFMRVNHYA